MRKKGIDYYKHYPPDGGPTRNSACGPEASAPSVLLPDPRAALHRTVNRVNIVRAEAGKTPAHSERAFGPNTPCPDEGRDSQCPENGSPSPM
jgi:hypothetical protein